MTTIIKLICWAMVFTAIVTSGQAQRLQQGSEVQCYIPPDSPLLQQPRANLQARNGFVHTQLGSLRGMIICVGFTGDDNRIFGGWPTGANSFPDNLNPQNPILVHNDPTDFPASHLTDLGIQEDNMSNFLFRMSLGQFRLMFDVYPTRINISPTGFGSFAAANQEVIRQMRIIDPQLNWGAYDNRTFTNGFTMNNSLSLPDGIPDFIIFVYRYFGDQQWVGGGGGIAHSVGFSAANSPYPGVAFSSAAGFTSAAGANYELFLHEYAHIFFGSPHYSLVNSVVGNHLERPIGWGFMNVGGGFYNCANALERWYCGWTPLTCQNIPSDIQNAGQLPPNGEFTLRDFITTGDMVRIRVPVPGGTDQFLWLENHQGLSVFDNRLWKKNSCPEPFPTSPRGLVAFIADANVAPAGPMLSLSHANYQYPLHPAGNYDYTYVDQYPHPCRLFGNPLPEFNEVAPNPMGRVHRACMLRGDYNADGVINQDAGTNSVASVAGGKNEARWVLIRNGQLTYDLMNSEMAFRPGSEIGTGTNPPLVNYATYNIQNTTKSASFLNGIRVTVLEQNPDGSIRIRIEFNDVRVRTSQRWTGTVVVPNYNPTGSDLVLDPDVNLLVNLDGNPNRHTLSPVTNRFMNPSQLELRSGARMVLGNGSKLIIDEGSTFTLNSGSELVIEQGADLWVRNGTLRLLGNARITVKETGAVNIACQSRVEASSQAVIDLQEINGHFTLHESASVATGAGLAANLNSIKIGVGIIHNYITGTVAPLQISNEHYYTDEVETSQVVLGRGNNEVLPSTWVIWSGDDRVHSGNDFVTRPGCRFEMRVENGCPNP